MATPHAIHEEFPADGEVIHALKVDNAHFAKLLVEYDEINDQVENAAANVTPMDGLAETDLRKKRSHLKDQIARMITEAKA
ncbi:YdcH family protein [Paracoccus jiaweipingae]|uniref:YdcH family protein n=1 Tax=unclassified Paracoccus (in: a-proteobacteria) TaxID=2688777 RepID=UPI0037AF1111